jgi:pyrroline-5-carboxylate reductase
MKTGIIGYGNMGQAIIRGIIANGAISRENLFVAERDKKKLDAARSKCGINAVASNRELVENCGVIILAVKPGSAEAVLRDAAASLKGKLLISICAGITTKKLESYFKGLRVVRVMPNLPAVISQGVSALSCGRFAAAKDKKTALSIFSGIGEVIEVKEGLMDAVTAISGSGPAYFFYLAERMIEAAMQMGIPRATAQKLVLKTASGSAGLMCRSKQGPRTLRQQVSSKGGTTEAAFSVFNKKGLDNVLMSAFKAAAKRAAALTR